MARGLRIGYARAVRIAADGASYAHTGQAAGLNRGLKVVGAFGSYSVTGQAANLSEGVGAASYLESVANSLDPGYWVELTAMGGLTYSLILDPSGVANILDYCNKGGADVPGSRLLFQGGAHTGAGGLTGAIRYDIPGNSWAQITPSYSSSLSHNWDSSCSDPVRGDFYAFSKTSSTVRRLPSGSTTWSTIAALSISTPESLSLFWDEGRDGLMAWNRNTGLEFWAYSSGSGSWSSRGAPSGLSGALGMAGCYCADGSLFLSDGTSNSTRYWTYSTSNAFSSAQTAPVPVFVAQGGASIVSQDTGSGRIIVTHKTTGVMQSFNPYTGLWRSFTPSNGVVPLNVNQANTDAFSIDLPDLGCTLFFSGNSNGQDPSCYLYRHTSAPIVPETITFTAPGSHDMTQYVENYSASTMLLTIDQTLPAWLTFDGEDLIASSSGSTTGLTLRVTSV